jgi:hypothetical protein
LLIFAFNEDIITVAMRRFLLSVGFIVLIGQLAFAQNPFRTRQSGNWNDPNTWEEDTGGGFNVTLNIPTSASGVITIRNLHTVTATADVTIDETTIQSGGSIIIDPGITLTLDEDFSSTPLTIDSGGSLTNNGALDLATFLIISPCVVNGSITNGNVISIFDGSLLQFNSGSNYFHNFSSGGSIPLATWDSNSTCEITNLTAASPSAPSNLNQPFGNFRWNTPSMGTTTTFSLGGQLTSVAGNLIFVSSNTRAIRFNRAGGGYTLNITGNFDNQGAPLILADNLSSAVVVNVGGTYTQSQPTGSVPSFIFFAASNAFDATINIAGGFARTAGTISRGSASSTSVLSTFNFNGSAVQTYSYSGLPIGTQINYSVASGATLDVGTSAITGSGSFVLNGTLRVGSVDAAGAIQTGTTNGNIRVSGTRTYATGSTVIYNGVSAQFIGSGHPANSNTTINNSNSVTLASDVTINGNLILTAGNLSVSSSTLTLGANFTPNSNFLAVNSSSSLSIGGSSSFGNLALSGGPTINNFTLNRGSSGSITLVSDLTVNGTFTQSNGDINLNGNTLRISGIYNRTAGNKVGSSTSSIIVDGSGSFTGILGITSQLNTLTINRTGVTINTGSAFTVTNLNLLNGTFNNGGTITMASGGAVLTRNAGSLLNPVVAATSFDVTYTNSSGSAIATGSELPTNASDLRNLTINSTDPINLNAAVTINGTLTFTSGVFNAGSNSIDLKGDLLSNNSSSLTSSAITFSGTTSVTGSTAPVFGNITITGSLTPTTSLNINGNLVNNGTLNSGSATVTFGGTTVISGTSICSFNNLVISPASSLTGPLNGTINVAGTWTNNGAFTNNGGTVLFNGTSSITGATNFGGVTVSGTLTSPATLNVARNFTNNGTFNASTGVLVLNGSTGQSIGGSTATSFYDITCNNPSTVTVTTSQNITGVLTINNGTFNANGNLTLISNAAGDARVGAIAGGASLSGSVIAQRYLPNTSGARAYRFLASPVTGAFVSSWKSSFPITGTFNDPSTPADFGGAFPSLVQSSPSMFFYNEPKGGTVDGRYDSYPLIGTNSSAAAITNGIGYAAYVRQTIPITLSVSGPIAQGNSVPVPVTAQSGGGNDGWNLIGNPFPAPINWGSVTIPGGVGTQISFRDNTNNIGLGAGQYVYYTQGGAGIPASYTGTISMGQAFFVRATSNTSIVFKEADKEAVRSPQFIRKATIDNMLRVHLTGAGRADELIIRLVDKAKDQSDNLFDAFKLTNDFLNFSSVSTDGVKMAINAASLFNSVNSTTERKVFRLRVEGNAAGVIAAGSYKFSFSEMETFGGDVNIIVKDNLMKDSVQITGQSKELTFSVTADPKTYGDRFELIIARPSITTAVEDAFPSDRISIYPNPTNGAVQIEVSKDFAGSVKVLSSIGQELGAIALENNGELLKGSFDLSSQAAGFYFIRVVEGTKVYAKKVIKR